MSVGKSEGRTPGKHALLNAVLGKQAGAFWRSKQWMNQPFVIIDLCAGDGVDTEESGLCSPKIIKKHSQWIRCQFNSEQASIVILVEKDPGTFDILSNSPHYSDCILIKGDSNSNEVTSQITSVFKNIPHSNKCPVFIHHDPNSVTNWCLNKEYLELSDLVTTMVTMGCNVSGIKRLGFEERKQWFDNFNVLKRQVKSTNGRLDLCLSALKGDCSNWAYSLSSPSVWIDDMTSATATAFRKWANGIELEWMNDSPIEFDRLVHKLFLTKKEFEELENEYNA
jgi:hypothetical protein